MAAGSIHPRPLGVSRSFGNTASPTSLDENVTVPLSRSFDDRQSVVATKRAEYAASSNGGYLSVPKVTIEDEQGNTVDQSKETEEKGKKMKAGENHEDDAQEVTSEEHAGEVKVIEKINEDQATAVNRDKLGISAKQSEESYNTSLEDSVFGDDTQVYESLYKLGKLGPDVISVSSDARTLSGETSSEKSDCKQVTDGETLLDKGTLKPARLTESSGDVHTVTEKPSDLPQDIKEDYALSGVKPKEFTGRHLLKPEGRNTLKRNAIPTQLSPLPHLLKGVKHQEPLTPTESFVTGTSVPSNVSTYYHDLSPLQEGGSYSEQSESDLEANSQGRVFNFRESGASENVSSNNKHKMSLDNRQFQFSYMKEALETPDPIITKSVPPCLTPIQELTEISSSAYTSPAENSDAGAAASACLNPRRKPLGTIVTNNGHYPHQYMGAGDIQDLSAASSVPTENNGTSSCVNQIQTVTNHVAPVSPLPPAVALLDKVIPNPPHNTPDSFVNADSTLFFVEPFWEVAGTSSSSPRNDKYDR